MANADHHPRCLARWLGRRAPLLLGLAIVLAACGSSSDTTSDATAPESAPDATTSDAAASEPSAEVTVDWVVPNQGGANEGHTPRGFQGSGTGLFAGDELNTNFPPEDGVQIWLSFELPADVDTVSDATLRSDALSVRGNPFETLGDLEIAPVRYETFGPSVVPLEPVGPTVICPPPSGSTFTCDVADAVSSEIDAGRSSVQFRLRFEEVSDPDGEQDLALFFLTDSNTNEPGIFNLELSS